MFAGMHKVRQVTKVHVPGLANPVYVYNNTYVNLERGLAERVYNVESGGEFRPPPRPLPGAFERMREFADAVVKSSCRTTRVDYDEFVAMYSGRKATIYAAAAASCRLSPVTKRDAQLSTFVKAEKVIPTRDKQWPAPRVIQPRSPRYNVEVGRFLKPLEHILYRGMAKVWGEPVVMKGYTVEGVARVLRAKWTSFRRPVAIGLDASRFDQHVSVEALRWEHGVYLRMFPPNQRRELARLLSWQVENKGVARASNGRIKYSVRGCRMSGDMNTALGNCLLMCGLVYTYARSRAVECKLVNNGDDCVVILEERDLNRFLSGLSGWFLEMGFTMKVEEPVREFERIEFCRMRPVQTVNGWIMVRNVADALVRDFTTVLSIRSARDAMKWWHAVGLGGASITPGVPVFQSIYQRMVAMGLPSRMVESPWMQDQGFTRLQGEGGDTSVTPAARISFWRAFGITPAAQEELEAMAWNASWAPGVQAQAGAYSLFSHGKG